MKSILEFMGNDHNRLETIFKKFRTSININNNKRKLLFSEFKNGLEQHIVWEEEILFPLFEDRTGMKEHGPTAVMRIEHTQIKKFLASIHDKLAKNDFGTKEFELQLIELLTKHNFKEENILYPWVDNELSEQEIISAFDKIKKLR